VLLSYVQAARWRGFHERPKERDGPVQQAFLQRLVGDAAGDLSGGSGDEEDDDESVVRPNPQPRRVANVDDHQLVLRTHYSTQYY